MNESRKLPEVPASSLRDHGTEERVDAIWQRLETELGAPRPRPRNVWLWAPAALCIVFGSGVWVGARWVKAPHADMAVNPEPFPGGDEATRTGQPPSNVQPDKAAEPTQNKDKRSVAPGHSNLGPDPLLEPPGVQEQVLPPTGALPPISVAQPEWQALTSSASTNADYAAAWQALQRQGGFDAVFAKASSAEQLMALVDLARANKQPGFAIKALRAVIERYPSNPNASLAALTLGDMLENAGDRAGAAKAYATYRSLSPTGDFAEDALARQFDAAIGEKNVDLAKQLAEQYAKDFPSGRHLGDMRARLGKLTGVEPGAVKADAARSPDETPWDEGDDEAPAPQKPAKPPAK